ncbi:MAG TPA: YCF48-related protein [Gemmataceae bacterium]|nr:YCF48-related protein [Gemmataceae bacterium]
MRLCTALLGVLLFALPTRAADPPTLDALLRSGGFQYRNLGPFRCGSWVADVAVPETPAKAHLYTFYVAARNGGLWKTTNNGTTFQQVFENQTVSSMGCVAVAPSNADIVWIGTGDASCTRSAYWGDGVYKSTNAGRTWQNMGLKDSQHVARIVIHPVNPDVVYVAALGHLFTTNEERGVFQTTDGGQTWKKILYVDDKTGAVDVVMDRSDPNVLYAATYQYRRDGWVLHDGGPGTAVYKTTDGGANWDKLTNGLPSGTVGRIGLDICRSNPKILYAVLENHDAGGGAVYRTDDAGATWRKVSPASVNISSKSGYAFNQIRVDPNNPDRIIITGSSLYYSQDGGKTFGGSRPFGRAFGDFRVFWFDPENSDRMIAGSDGGVYLSYDGGGTCDHYYNLPLGEVYALSVDMETPYNVYVGLQDHESWKGPSRGVSGSVEGIAAWSTVGVGDGMYNQVDPTDSRWLYNTQEFGQPARFDQRTRTRTTITPARQNQGGRRFNWVTPLRLSPHDPKIVYVGADVLFRSQDRGDTWEIISPDLTTNDPSKIRQGPSIQFCTITTISESPAAAGVIWVGCDDGKVQVTRDFGKSWTDVTEAIAKAGGPADAWVTRVFGSHHQPGTAYVAKSQHRRDDFRPFLYKTTDSGATWTPIVDGLPQRPINVVVEDNKNPNFLAVGTDNGVHVSITGGAHWAPLKANMPVVPTHDLLIHPRDGDLVVGTYGRGVWITNVDPLRELTEELMNKDVHFFSVTPQAKRSEGALGTYRLLGDRHLTTPNGPGGLVFDYYLRERPEGRLRITLTNAAGTTVRTLPGTNQVGINRVALNLNEFGGGRGGRRGGGPAQAPPAAGNYVATLTVGDTKLMQKVRILPLEGR